MSAETLVSFLLLTIETYGSIYFFNTFLQQKNSRLQKYRFPFLIVCIAIGAFSSDWIGGWKVLLIMMACVLLCLIFYKATFVQSVFFSVLNYGMLIGIEYLSISVMDWRLFLTQSWGENQAGAYLVILLSRVLWIIALLVVRRFRRQREEDYPLTNKEWATLSVIPMITVCAILAMIYCYTVNEQIQSFYLFLSMGLAVIDLVVLQLMQNLLEKEKALRISALVNQNQRNQLSVYEDGKKLQEQQQRKMHDYKNQLSTIQTLLKSGDHQTALLFTEKLTESISENLSAINTGHAVVNAVVNQKYRRAKEKNISMSLKVGNLQELKMREEDIVIVLGNLLDNAIAECERVLAGGAKGAVIFLKMALEDGNLILSVKNPVLEKVRIEDSTVQKKYTDGHGIGLLNVKAVVDKYQGDMALDCDDKEFRVAIML